MTTLRNHCLPLLCCLLLAACGAPAEPETTGVSAPPAAAPTAPPTERVATPHSVPPPAELTEGEPEVAEPAAAITRIRDGYARIRRQLELEVLRADVTDFNCADDPREGRLVRYYDDDRLVMVEVSEASEHSWETRTFYLEDGRPFFVFEEAGSWTFGGPLNEEAPNTIDRITETRYYLENGEIIRQLTKSYENKSWEDGPSTEEVPNVPVPEATGSAFPYRTDFAELLQGRIAC